MVFVRAHDLLKYKSVQVHVKKLSISFRPYVDLAKNHPMILFA